MARPQFNRAHSNVEDWLDGHYEYIAPDDLGGDKGTKSYAYTPKDPFGDVSTVFSDKSSSRGKAQPSHHRSAQDHYRPMTPPSEGRLERERERARDRDYDRHHRSHKTSSRSGHDVDRDEDRQQARHHHHHRDEPRYPPRAGRGRPQRPTLNTRQTTPDFSREERQRDRDRDRRHERRYSHSSSPPRHREDKTSSPRHHRRHDDDTTTSSRHNNDDSSHYRRDRDRDHRTSTKPQPQPQRRPSLSHSQTAPGVPQRPKGRRTSSFSGFLSDPRFTAAATAALQAGATAAVGAVGSPGAGVKVARAALGAAALGALKSPGPSTPAEPARAKDPAEAMGGYFADRVGRRESTRRRR